MSAVSTGLLRMRLDHCPDPARAFAALCDRGTSPGTALLESADTGHGGSRRSLLVLSSAIRITLEGDTVSLEAQGANGRAALRRLDADDGCLDIPVPHSQARGRDERDRLLGPCALDPLRTVLDRLRPRRAQERRYLKLVGATTFELAERFEYGVAETGGLGYLFLLPELYIEIDHLRAHAELVAVVFDEHAGHDLARRMERIADMDFPGDEPIEPHADSKHVPAWPGESCSDTAFEARVECGRALVRAGEVFQLVLSRHWSLPCKEPFDAYRRLRRDNPSPYLFYLCDRETTLFGASPESALKLDARSRMLEIYPVAGTRARGGDPDEDSRIEAELRHDAKELSEHMMLLDLARNDVARVCEPGSRNVPLLLGVDRFAHVMHLVSRVTGKLRAGLDALHALRACLNMGTLTGAPKLRAMQAIREVEGEPRGFYGGTVGLLDGAGNLDTAITIRAATVHAGIARVQAGAGIVLDSDPARESAETRDKAMAVVRAIAGAAA